MKRANRLYELRTSRRLSQVAVAMKLNLTKSRVSAYENGENIPCDVLLLFSDFYGVSVDYILRVSDKKKGELGSSLHVSEEKLVSFYRNLAPDGRAVIDGMVKGYAPPKS